MSLSTRQEGPPRTSDKCIVTAFSTVYRLANEFLRRAERAERAPSPSEELGIEEVSVDQRKAEADALRAKALEMMDFSEENFPYDVVIPDPFIIVRAGIMYDRLGKKDKANEYFDFAKNRSLKTLTYYGQQGETFKKQNDYMISDRLHVYLPNPLLGVHGAALRGMRAEVIF